MKYLSPIIKTSLQARKETSKWSIYLKATLCLEYRTASILLCGGSGVEDFPHANLASQHLSDPGKKSDSYL